MCLIVHFLVTLTLLDLIEVKKMKLLTGLLYLSYSKSRQDDYEVLLL